MNTGASITLGVHTESSIEVTPGTLGTSQEIIIDINIISIIRKMSTESRKETIIGITTVPIQETDPGTPKEMTNPEIHLGETQEDSTETHLETDMMEEDREREATALEMIETEGMMTGEVMPAMGADTEKVARRP